MYRGAGWDLCPACNGLLVAKSWSISTTPTLICMIEWLKKCVEFGSRVACGNVEVVDSKGCSRLVVGLSSGIPAIGSRRFAEPMSSASPASMVRHPPAPSLALSYVSPDFPKARKQAMDATERLGGKYSGNLHPQCTHLVVQSFGGRKLEHALKHRSKSGLSVVTLGWFVDSVKRNVKMCESLYCVKTTVQNGLIVRELNWPVHFMEGENACLPATFFGDHKPSDAHEPLKILDDDLRNSNESTLAGSRIYVDSDLSADLCRKVYDAATSVEATCVDNWFRGCSASLVVCEAPSITRYIGHSSNIVTPLWLIKTVKDKRVQRLVRLSVDLARQIGMVLENFQDGHLEQENAVDGGQIPGKLFSKIKYIDTVEGRRQKVHLAKMDTRSRRSHETQSHKLPIRPINPSTLLDSICWSISEPTSVASVHIEQFLMNGIGDHSSVFFVAHGVLKDLQDSFDHFTRPLTEREKEDALFKNHFLTILFPLDRFGKLSPSSKTFFSSKGFNCIQFLDHIYKFYQENLSAEEIEMAIHTDSRHANCLRSVYASKDSLERGFVTFKRIEFIGRRSFELLKRVSGGEQQQCV